MVFMGLKKLKTYKKTMNLAHKMHIGMVGNVDAKWVSSTKTLNVRFQLWFTKDILKSIKTTRNM